jgi:hypothetical protein
MDPPPAGQTVIDGVRVTEPTGSWSGKAFRVLRDAAEHFHL